MKKLKLIYIEWFDACSFNSWQSYEEAMEYAKDDDYPYVSQVGWILHEDDKSITLAGRHGMNIFNGQHPSEENYGLLQKIPKTWIRKRKIIKL